jgi:uncharacterized Zn finger protein (UPF0148 family)
VKICPLCQTTGEDTYCPTCRKSGKIRLLFSAAQLTRKVERMRAEAVRIKAAIERLNELAKEVDRAT